MTFSQSALCPPSSQTKMNGNKCWMTTEQRNGEWELISAQKGEPEDTKAYCWLVCKLPNFCFVYGYTWRKHSNLSLDLYWEKGHPLFMVVCQFQLECKHLKTRSLTRFCDYQVLSFTMGLTKPTFLNHVSCLHRKDPSSKFSIPGRWRQWHRLTLPLVRAMATHWEKRGKKVLNPCSYFCSRHIMNRALNDDSRRVLGIFSFYTAWIFYGTNYLRAVWS